MNIIFDLGGVVFNWVPEKLIDEVFPDDKLLKDKIAKDLYGHSDWAELDKGNLNFREASLRAELRTGIPAFEIMKLLNHIFEFLIPKKDTLRLIEELYQKKHKLYVLSNMSHEVADYLEREYSFWGKFDGIVFSARINLIKPSPEIYEYILNKYSLKAEETVFFDDMKKNVEAATALGIQGIQFVNAEQAKKELKKFNI